MSLAKVIDLQSVHSVGVSSVCGLGPFAPDPRRAVLTVGCGGPRKGSVMGEAWWMVGLWSEIY
jgi:hypothetical protein